MKVVENKKDDDGRLPCWNSFRDAPFEEPIQQALSGAGFTEPSPVQAQAWPAALSGKDVIGVAKTGSGKTLGFLLPVFHRISTKNLPLGATEAMTMLQKGRGLLVSPTRELAMQIHKECVKFGTPIGISATVLYGGANANAQIQELRKGGQIVVATPGRLCDLLDRKSCLTLNNCHFIILDEADRMLDMGFEPQLKQITTALPEKSSRQTLFFTATWPKAVRKVAAKFMRGEQETIEIFIGEGTANGELVANKSVKQTFIEAQDDMKDKILYDFLCGLDEKASVVIFANTKRRVDFVAKMFWQEGFTTCAVHGDKQQHERDTSLRKFVSKECAILVATDVAARGLDIKGVTHVVNFDMARDCDSYIHRIGRTGRAGEVGEAVTFWNPDYDKVCSPALVKIARDAGQEVPAFLQKYEKIKGSKQWKITDAEKAKDVLSASSS
ncbi:DEAD-domain-containing protein [Fragilariopsis cylindrus CCMP1102]|uniref:RNA helicase n=1 Tax=Fragilariopsis cylindrus CCMP1102 TaxID=635003 RepID=A0A1E7FM83_9STRA|nr:DEAD-domain-containing protein [Fragilariopsis cylindrus CCMP1102]|eukprot:OEU19270.1 DEAD-domain-containing protein [Fragilariopsis cylindrus CCMP1102]